MMYDVGAQLLLLQQYELFNCRETVFHISWSMSSTDQNKLPILKL